MDRAEMKRLLGLSKTEPVSCAVGVGKDPGTALLLLDKQKQPKAVEALLSRQFDDAKTTRWGTVSVDSDNDAKLVVFTLNKPGSGLAKRLAKTLKGTGFSKVMIRLEDGSIAESHAEETEAEPDRGALVARLAGLIPRVAAATAQDPQRGKTLAQHANEANDSIKSGDLRQALSLIDKIDAALQAATSANSSASGPVAFGKASLIWRTCHRQLSAKLEELKSAMLAAYADEPEVAKVLGTQFGELDRVFEVLDDSLAQKLDDASQAADPLLRQKLAGEARVLLSEYIQFVAADPLISGLDSNPFGVTINFKDTASKALSAVVGLAKTAA
jgi:hypothetical protein